MNQSGGASQPPAIGEDPDLTLTMGGRPGQRKAIEHAQRLETDARLVKIIHEGWGARPGPRRNVSAPRALLPTGGATMSATREHR
jgi:hypothetical protein